MFRNQYSQSQNSVHDRGKKFNKKQVATQTDNEPGTSLSRRILSRTDGSPRHQENVLSKKSPRRSIALKSEAGITHSASCSCSTKQQAKTKPGPPATSRISIMNTGTRTQKHEIKESIQNYVMDSARMQIQKFNQQNEEKQEIVNQKRKTAREWNANKREVDEMRRHMQQLEFEQERLKKVQEEQRRNPNVFHYNTWAETRKSKELNKRLEKISEAIKAAEIETEMAKQREEDSKRAYTEWMDRKFRPDLVPSYIHLERTVSLEPVMFYRPVSLFPNLEIREMKRPAKPQQKPNVDSKTNSKLERELVKPCGVGAIRKQKFQPEAKTERQLESHKAHEDWMEAINSRSKPKPPKRQEPQRSNAIRRQILPTIAELLARQVNDNQMHEKGEDWWRWLHSNPKSKFQVKLH